MAKLKVAVTLDADTLRRIDQLVRDERFPNRSQAIEASLGETLARLDRRRLADACAQLDPTEERALADEGLTQDVASWPEY